MNRRKFLENPGVSAAALTLPGFYGSSQKVSRVLLLMILIMITSGCVSHQDRITAAPKQPYEANWESLKKIPVAKWFDDAKFGIFIHWGPYSVIGHLKGGRGYAEWVPTRMYAKPDYYYPYLKNRFGGHPPEFGYKDIVKQFKAEKWDPEAWAELFKNAGAKYVVLTGEHHDGYAMWDSDLTPWCATKVGPMRDLVGELGKAVRAKGMKYAPSYHRERHTGFFAMKHYEIKSPPRPDIAEEIRRHPQAADLYGPFEYSDAFIADYMARWKELQRKYKPDFMWIDDIPIFYWTEEGANHPQTRKFKDSFQGLIADYFNAAQGWGKEVYLNNKGKHLNWPEGIGCREKDNLQMDTAGPKWENPATLGTSYGYLAIEEEKDLYKPSRELIHLLCDVVSKNGNLLFNIGPRSDGIIPQGMQDRLLDIGRWLDVNDEAIYGTRVWKIYGEAIIPNSKKRKHAINSTGIRFTRSANGKFVYAICFEWPEKPLTIKSFTNDNIANVELLGSDRKLAWNMTDSGLNVTLPSRKPCEYAFVLKITKMLNANIR